MNTPFSLNFLQQRGLLITLLGSSFLLLAAFAYEKITGLLPCPLCWLQRGVFVGFFLISLTALLLSYTALFKRLSLIRWLFIVAFALVMASGVGVALRHLYIKLNPNSVGCGLDVETLLDFFPLQDALAQMLVGSSDCAQAANFFGLPLPVWSLTGYLLLGSLAIYSLLTSSPT
ncbi:MAG: disulfide bond formation protein B [Pseudomonadaceae bacterium]|nr:disulfide bond formation protein B [Pseudomonadaceae bacterium]